MANRHRWSPESSSRRVPQYYDERAPRPSGAEEYLSSSSSSSSSSYIDISRKFSLHGVRAFFTTPSEHRKLRRRRSSKLLKHGNSSSSSINSDLAYGTGFLKRPKRRGVRSRRGKEIDRENYRTYVTNVTNEHNREAMRDFARENTKGYTREGRGLRNEGRGTDAAILAVGAGLAKLARDQNKRDLNEAKNQKMPGAFPSDSPRYRDNGATRGLRPSKVSHHTADAEDDGWESASDAESESSVDSKLAFGAESTAGWLPWGKKTHGPQKRKSSVVDPRLFGRQNSLRGVLDEPVGFGEVTWSSSSDFGQRGGYMPPSGPQPYYDQRNNNPATPAQIMTNHSQTGFYPPPSSAPFQPAASSASGSRAPPMQHVYPMPTDDPSRFDVVRGSVVSGEEPYVSSRPRPLPIQQPQPVTPVSQSVYDSKYASRSEPIVPRISTSSSNRGTSLAKAALMGVAGAAVGATLASDRGDRRDKRKDDEDSISYIIERKNDKDERRREKRREKEKPKDSDDDKRRDKKREKRRDEGRDSTKDREKRREDRRNERTERYESRPSKSEVSAISTAPVDPFQFQVDDDAFSTPVLPQMPNHSIISRTPTVVTVERQPDFGRVGGSAANDQQIVPRLEPRSREDWNTERRHRRDPDPRNETYHNAEVIYEETEHSTAPIEAAAMGAAIAAVTGEDRRESRSERRRDERRSGQREYEVYEEVQSRDAPWDKKPEPDPVQEEADRAYREILMARKIASQVIRSRSPSPGPSVIYKYDDDQQKEETVRIVTPPGMEEHKKKGPYDAPNADFQLDYVLEHPKDLRNFSLPTSTGQEGPYLKRDPDASLPRPHLNLVRPTPSPTPAPEMQAARSEKNRSRTSTTSNDHKDKTQSVSAKEVVVDTKRNVVASTSTTSSTPTSSTTPKGVTWGENETKHYTVESPSEHRDEFVSNQVQNREKPTEKPPGSPRIGKRAGGWSAIVAGVTGASFAAASDTSSKAKENDKPKDQTIKDAPYEYRAIVVEPENSSPARTDQHIPPQPGPKPSSPQTSSHSSHMPGSFDDMDFAATVAAGLQDTGFDPNIVIDDPSFRRRESPPVTAKPSIYHPPFAEAVSDLSSIPTNSSRDAAGFGIGDIPETPEDWNNSLHNDDFATPIRLTKKEQKKREKAARMGISEVFETPLQETPSQQAEERESYPETSKLSKKEQKKRDKAAQRSSMQIEDTTPISEPSVTRDIVEPESYFETPKKSKKGSSTFGYVAKETPKDDERVSVPVDTFNGKHVNEDEGDVPKKSKKNSKRDSDRFDSPPRSVVSEGIPESSSKKSKRDSEIFDSPSRSVVSGGIPELKRSSSKKSKRDSGRLESPTRSAVSESAPKLERSSNKTSKDKSRRNFEVYGQESDPGNIALPSVTASEVSRDGDFDESRKSRKSSKRDSGDLDALRSIVSEYADDDYKKSKKKSRSAVKDKDDFEDTRSIASAPAGDEEDRKNKKREKRSSGGFFGLFGSAKSEIGARDESPKGTKDDFGDIKKKSKKLKRSSMPDDSGLYGDLGSKSTERLARVTSNGNEHSSCDHYDHDDDDRTEKKPGRSRVESTSSKNDSFLASAGTFGAGVGVAGAAAALAQHHQQSKADSAGREWLVEDIPPTNVTQAQQQYELHDPEITQRDFRPSIDPQYGDLLPLPPSVPASPSKELNDDLPNLPESRPDTPEAERLTRERNLSSVRKSLQETPMKSPSHSAVPLKFIMGNRSNPVSPGLVRATPVQSPATPTPDSLTFPRSRARPTSWDNTKEFKPLYLVESNRRPSFVQPENQLALPSLPPSEIASRGSSVLDPDEFVSADEYAKDDNDSDQWYDSRYMDRPLSIDTSRNEHELLGSQQSTPKALIFSDADYITFPSQDESPKLSRTKSAQVDESSKAHENENIGLGLVAGAALTGAAYLLSYRDDPSRDAHSEEEKLFAHSAIPHQPSPVEPMSKDRSSYLLQSSPLPHRFDDADHEAQSPLAHQSTLRSIDYTIAGIEEAKGDVSDHDAQSEFTGRNIYDTDITMEDPPSSARVADKSTIEDVEMFPSTEFTKSKKDRKKDKKKGKGLARTSPFDDFTSADVETQASGEHSRLYVVNLEPSVPTANFLPTEDASIIEDRSVDIIQDDDEPVEGVFFSKSKKDKKKDKKRGKATPRTSTLDDIPSIEPTEEPIMDATNMSIEPPVIVVAGTQTPLREFFSPPDGSSATPDIFETPMGDAQHVKEYPFTITGLEKKTERQQALCDVSMDDKTRKESSQHASETDLVANRIEVQQEVPLNVFDSESKGADIIDNFYTPGENPPGDALSFLLSEKDKNHKKKGNESKSAIEWTSEPEGAVLQSEDASRSIVEDAPEPELTEPVGEYSPTKHKKDKKKDKRKSGLMSSDPEMSQPRDVPVEETPFEELKQSIDNVQDSAIVEPAEDVALLKSKKGKKNDKKNNKKGKTSSTWDPIDDETTPQAVLETPRMEEPAPVDEAWQVDTKKGKTKNKKGKTSSTWDPIDDETTPQAVLETPRMEEPAPVDEAWQVDTKKGKKTNKKNKSKSLSWEDTEPDALLIIDQATESTEQTPEERILILNSSQPKEADRSDVPFEAKESTRDVSIQDNYIDASAESIPDTPSRFAKEASIFDSPLAAREPRSDFSSMTKQTIIPAQETVPKSPPTADLEDSFTSLSKKDKKQENNNGEAASWDAEEAKPSNVLEPAEEVEAMSSKKKGKKSKKSRDSVVFDEAVVDTAENTEINQRDQSIRTDISGDKPADVEHDSLLLSGSKKGKKKSKKQQAWDPEISAEEIEAMVSRKSNDMPVASDTSEPQSNSNFLEHDSVVFRNLDQTASSLEQSIEPNEAQELPTSTFSAQVTQDGLKAGYDNDQLSLARQLQQDFGKKSKKDKKKRQSLSSTPDPEAPRSRVSEFAESHSSARSLSVEPANDDSGKRVYSEDQLELARQLKAEFEGGSKRSKKDKKKRQNLVPDDYQDSQESSRDPYHVGVGTNVIESVEPNFDSAKGDGLTVGYQEDQLSLARQLQAEFGSGSKKSKDKKRRSTSLTLIQEPEGQEDYFRIQSQPIDGPAPTEEAIATPDPRTDATRDGIAAGYKEDQLELARQLKEEFSSGSTKSKKGNKRQSLSRGASDGYASPRDSQFGMEYECIRGHELVEEPLETPAEPEDEPAFAGKKSKKDKKGKKRESIAPTAAAFDEPTQTESKDVNEDFDRIPIASEEIVEPETPEQEFSLKKSKKDKKGKKRESPVPATLPDIIDALSSSKDTSQLDDSSILELQTRGIEETRIPEQFSTKKSKKDKKTKKRDSILRTDTDDLTSTHALCDEEDTFLESGNIEPEPTRLSEDVIEKAAVESATPEPLLDTAPTNIGAPIPVSTDNITTQEQYQLPPSILENEPEPEALDKWALPSKKSKKDKKRRSSGFQTPADEAPEKCEASRTTNPVEGEQFVNADPISVADVQQDDFAFSTKKSKKNTKNQKSAQLSFEDDVSPEATNQMTGDAPVIEETALVQPNEKPDDNFEFLAKKFKKDKKNRKSAQLSFEDDPPQSADCGIEQLTNDALSIEESTPAQPDDNLISTAKKTKKDKKNRKSLLSSQELPGMAEQSAQQPAEEPIIEAVTPSEPEEDAFEVTFKKSKKGKKNRKSLSSSQDMPEPEPAKSIEEALDDVATPIEAEDDSFLFTNRKSKEDKKDCKSLRTYPSSAEATETLDSAHDEQPTSSSADLLPVPISNIVDVLEVAIKTPLPLDGLLPTEEKNEPEDDERGSVPVKKSNGKKKLNSGPLTPLQSELQEDKAVFEDGKPSDKVELQEDKAVFEDGKPSDKVEIPHPTETSAEVMEEPEEEFSIQRSKKGKKKAKSGLSTPLELASEPIQDISAVESPKITERSELDDEWANPSSSKNTKKDKKKTKSGISTSIDFKIKPAQAVTASETTPAIDEQKPDDKWVQSSATKKSKRDKKKAKFGLSTPLEVESQERYVETGYMGDIANEATEVVQHPEVNWSTPLSSKKSKKDNKGKGRQLSTQESIGYEALTDADEKPEPPEHESEPVEAAENKDELIVESIDKVVSSATGVDVSLPLGAHVQEPDAPPADDWDTAFTAKKSSKDKKSKNSSLSTPAALEDPGSKAPSSLNETLDPVLKFETPIEPEQLLDKSVDDEWGGFPLKKSKKDKKSKKSGLSTPAALEDPGSKAPSSLNETLDPVLKFETPIEPEQLLDKSVDDEWGGFPLKKSKKDKKSKKSGLSTPAALEDPGSKAPSSLNETLDPVLKFETPIEPEQLLDKSVDDELGGSPLKKSKKDKKNRKSGVSTPIVDKAIDGTVLENAIYVPQTESETISGSQLDATQLEDEWRSVSAKKSKKEKINCKSEASAPFEDDKPVISVEDVSPVSAQPESRLVPSSQFDAPQPDDEWESVPTKKDKEDKENCKSGLSTPIEEVVPVIEPVQTPAKDLSTEDVQSQPQAERELPVDEPSTEGSPMVMAMEDNTEDYFMQSRRASKKDKKNQESLVEHAPYKDFPLSPEEVFTSLVQMENDLPEENLQLSRGSNVEASDKIVPAEKPEVADEFPITLGREESKKDKRQVTTDATISEEPSSSRELPMTTWPDEVEEVEVERSMPVIDKTANDESLSHISTTIDTTPVDDFARPTKKGNKGKKKDAGSASSLRSPTTVSTGRNSWETPSKKPVIAAATAIVGAAAAAALDNSTPTKKLSKKEQRKLSIDKRAPRDDLFDDPSLWEGKEPAVFEETKGVDVEDDGFWSSPQLAEHASEHEIPREIPTLEDSIVHQGRVPIQQESNLQNVQQQDLEHAAYIHEFGSSREDERQLEKPCFSEHPQKIRGNVEHERELSKVPDQFVTSSSKKDKENNKEIPFGTWEFPEQLDDPTISTVSYEILSPNQDPELSRSIGFRNHGQPTAQYEPPPVTPSYGRPGSRAGSALPVVREESPELAEPEHIARHLSPSQTPTNINTDSAFVTDFSIPPHRGFTNHREHIHHSGVHLSDDSHAANSPAPSSSADDALARLSWPAVDEEAETVNLEKQNRKQDDTATRRAHRNYEAPLDKHALTTESDIHHRREDPAPKISGQGARRSVRGLEASSHDSPSLLHDDFTGIEPLPSQRTSNIQHSEGLHRSETIYHPPNKSQGESLVQQHVKPLESPDPPKTRNPKVDKYADLGPSQRPEADQTIRLTEASLAAGPILGGAGLGFAAARKSSGELRPTIATSNGSLPNINRLRTPDSLHRPESVTSNRSATATPPLRRSDRKSGDLRSLSQHQHSSPNLAKEVELAAITATSNVSSSVANPTANEGRVRAKEMADVYDGFGEGRMGSPRSPTRPHSMRRRQSMQVLDLEVRLEQLAAENRALADAKIKAENALQITQQASTKLSDKDNEIDQLKQTLDWLQNEVTRLSEVNDGLASANVTLGNQHNDRYGQLKSQHVQTTRELQEMREAHDNLSSGVEGIVRNEVNNVMQNKDQEIAMLRRELEGAKEQIRGMQQQILAAKANDLTFLTVRDEDYFDAACQKLCQHVQQWVLRFSKFSDMRACRLTSEINNDKIIDRLDNAILDGSDVDSYLADRVKRRDVFMSMTMTMVWEYVFTRYLFGMDREQRQKLKSLEKQLLDVGPASAVHQWRATTLTLLSRRDTFAEQKEQDTQAVVNVIMETLTEILPPPGHLEGQIQEQLVRVVKAAVDLSIEMRTQRAEYMMLPPLQPEYDANGDLASKVFFNAALMNERSGEGASNEQLEGQGATVRVVLFPLVVKKGDDRGDGDEEIVVSPAQVLVARPKKQVRLFTPESGMAQQNHSRVSMQSSMPTDAGDNVI